MTIIYYNGTVIYIDKSLSIRHRVSSVVDKPKKSSIIYFWSVYNVHRYNIDKLFALINHDV